MKHIIPQKIRATSWQVDEEIHQQCLYLLGNIVLVNKKKNASLSNASFAEKKHKYSSYIKGRANTNHAFITYQEWTEESIRKNHERVTALPKDYYNGNSLKALKEIKKKALIHF